VSERLGGHLAAAQGQPTRPSHARLLLFHAGICRSSRNHVVPRVQGQGTARHWRRLPQDGGFCGPMSPRASLGHRTGLHWEWRSPAPTSPLWVRS